MAKTELKEEEINKAYQTHTSNPIFMNTGKEKLQQLK